MRLIDAYAFCEWLKEYGQECIRGERWTSLKYIWEHVQNMPTITTEQHWIPTSKERPPQHQEIWITSDLGDVELVYGKDGIWLLYEGYYTEPEIVAWMPANVPEPYQPKEESE